MLTCRSGESGAQLISSITFSGAPAFCSSLGVLLSAESAIGSREQPQGRNVSRIRFGERFQAGKAPAKSDC